MAFVASDLEGTLTTGESWRGIGHYVKEHGRVRAYRVFLLARMPRYLATRLGMVDEQRFRDGWMARLAGLLKGMRPAELERIAEWVVEQELWPKRRERVLDELREHREAGRRLVLAAGVYQPILEAFASRIGAEAVGTPLEYSSGRTTGRLIGAVNTGEAKAERLAERVGAAGVVTAFGDTLADLRMLEMSEEPVAVAPDPRLREEAVKRGWRILEDEAWQERRTR
jgi:HAD superfamily phosphoserine phosphatase-like hydrolase